MSIDHRLISKKRTPTRLGTESNSKKFAQTIMAQRHGLGPNVCHSGDDGGFCMVYGVYLAPQPLPLSFVSAVERDIDTQRGHGRAALTRRTAACKALARRRQSTTVLWLRTACHGSNSMTENRLDRLGCRYDAGLSCPSRLEIPWIVYIVRLTAPTGPPSSCCTRARR